MKARNLLGQIEEMADDDARPGVVGVLTLADARLILKALSLAISRTPSFLDLLTADQLAVVIQFASPGVQAAARQRLDTLKVPRAQ